MLFHFKENNWLNLFNVGKRVMNPNKAMNTFIINFFSHSFLIFCQTESKAELVTSVFFTLLYWLQKSFNKAIIYSGHHWEIKGEEIGDI